MNGKKAIGKTIGEVEKLTGIPKRELKYYIEQDIMRPSQRTECGYWAYSNCPCWASPTSPTLSWDSTSPMTTTRTI